MGRVRRTVRASRENVLFVVGLLGIFYETVIVSVDRPWLLGVFAGMVGLDVIPASVEVIRGRPGRVKDSGATE